MERPQRDHSGDRRWTPEILGAGVASEAGKLGLMGPAGGTGLLPRPGQDLALVRAVRIETGVEPVVVCP